MKCARTASLLAGMILLGLVTAPASAQLGATLEAERGQPSLDSLYTGTNGSGAQDDPAFDPEAPGGPSSNNDFGGFRDDGEKTQRDENDGILPNSCRADVDGDGETGFDDLLMVLSEWGPCPVPSPQAAVGGHRLIVGECDADVDRSRAVGLGDLLAIIANYGQPCGPSR